ncbi:hypothetical protein [Neptunomonas phycophila]|uniref:hypothetical protein n=1 Tax=Neptunomonas phycophila TaxID=1572645 RepID=UPI0035187D79
MAKFIIEAYCFEHGGTIVKSANSKAEALHLLGQLKKTVLHDLNVSRGSLAVIQIANSKGVIKKERISADG